MYGEYILPPSSLALYFCVQSIINICRVRVSWPLCCRPPRPLQEYWLFWLWYYFLVDRSSFTLLQASFPPPGLGRGFWRLAVEIQQTDASSRELTSLEERAYTSSYSASARGKSRIKKEGGMERERVEGVFKQCKVKIVAQLPWQCYALGGQSPWLLTLPRSPRPLLETISLPISYCHFRIHYSPPSLYPLLLLC